MKIRRTMKIGNQLLLTFGALLLLTAGMSAAFWLTSAEVVRSHERANLSLSQLALMQELQSAIQAQLREVGDIVLFGRDPEQLRRELEQLQQAKEQAMKCFRKFSDLVIKELEYHEGEEWEEEAEEADLIHQMRDVYAKSEQFITRIILTTESGNHQRAQELYLELVENSYQRNLLDLIKHSIEDESEEVERSSQTAQKWSANSKTVALSGCLIASIIACISIHFLNGSFQRIKDSEKELSQFKTTLDKISDCVFMFDSQSLQFQYVNMHALVHVGYTEQELLSMTPFDIKPKFNEAEFRAMIQPMRDGETDVLHFETEHLHKEGHRIPVEIYLHYLRDSKGKGYFVSTVRDIIERKQQEAECEQAKEEAETANRAKGDFLAHMSHELRTPLNGILGMAELLNGTELTSKQRQFVNACRSSGESLLQLINDILDFSKIEAGRLELDIHEFNLEDLVTDTVETMSLNAAAKGLELPCCVDQMSRLTLKGDSGRLRQVLVNLISNAIKFTESGEVAVRTQMAAKQDNQITIRFSVTDTGIGIPADKLDRLFRSFSQVDVSTTRQFGGTGLGLAISKNLVNLMGGTIGVESEGGKGS
ncbi:MAG: ATP-binding protein, partial [Pirellulales bacterium]|nr:ATP-binding protein [Pirellulales bacterium]